MKAATQDEEEAQEPEPARAALRRPPRRPAAANADRAEETPTGAEAPIEARLPIEAGAQRDR